MVHAALRAEPWAIPGTLIAAFVALLVARPLARRLRVLPWLAWLLITTVGGFCALTDTPTGGSISGAVSTHVVRSLALSLPSPQDLHTINEVSLNVAAGIPLGAAVLAAAASGRRWWVMSLLGVPFACELVQGVLPGLGRVGFVLGDVIDNEVGVVLGMLLAATARALTRPVRANESAC